MPSRPDYAALSLTELRHLAADRGVRLGKAARKGDVIEALRAADLADQAAAVPMVDRPAAGARFESMTTLATAQRLAERSSSAPSSLGHLPSSLPPAAMVGRDHPKADPGLPIPPNYGRDRLVLMVQDPRHLFAYWELSGDNLRAVRERVGGDGQAVLLIETGGDADGREQREVDLVGGNYYLAVAPGREYRAHLALRAPDGRLHLIVSSAGVRTPLGNFSESEDEEWMSVLGQFDALVQRAGVRPDGSSGQVQRDRYAAVNWDVQRWREVAAAPIAPGLPPGAPATGELNVPSSAEMVGVRGRRLTVEEITATASSTILGGSHTVGSSGRLSSRAAIPTSASGRR